MTQDKGPPIAQELVADFVLKAHGDLDTVKRLLEQEPAIVNAAQLVRAMLRAHSEWRDARGPHGIPLVKHAEAGGEEAREVLEFLERQPATV